jgi:hypothetical protein
VWLAQHNFFTFNPFENFQGETPSCNSEQEMISPFGQFLLQFLNHQADRAPIPFVHLIFKLWLCFCSRHDCINCEPIYSLEIGRQHKNHVVGNPGRISLFGNRANKTSAAACSAGFQTCWRKADLEVCGTAGLETCATKNEMRPEILTSPLVASIPSSTAANWHITCFHAMITWLLA